ncbi:hypothetical protein ACJX0J_020469, partial [Zea mays]
AHCLIHGVKRKNAYAVASPSINARYCSLTKLSVIVICIFILFHFTMLMGAAGLWHTAWCKGKIFTLAIVVLLLPMQMGSRYMNLMVLENS